VTGYDLGESDFRVRGTWDGRKFKDASTLVRYSYLKADRPVCSAQRDRLETFGNDTNMATQYPQYPQGHPATYAPQRSIHGPYSNPQMGSTPSMPQRTSGQYRVDIYGRPLVQHGNGRSDSTPTGQAQYFPYRSGQAYPLSRGPSNQYSQSSNGEPDSMMYAPRNVARGYPSQPNGRDDGFPTAQRSPESPKE
jgi:hypothetical protein